MEIQDGGGWPSLNFLSRPLKLFFINKSSKFKFSWPFGLEEEKAKNRFSRWWPIVNYVSYF